MAAVLMLAAAGDEVRPRVSKHPYRPAWVTTRSVYICKDGTNTVTVQYDSIGKGQITNMKRGRRHAKPGVLDTLNKELSRFNFVSGLQYECGYGGDSIYVLGTIGTQRATAWLHWSLIEGNVVSPARPVEPSR